MQCFIQFHILLNSISFHGNLQFFCHSLTLIFYLKWIRGWVDGEARGKEVIGGRDFGLVKCREKVNMIWTSSFGFDFDKKLQQNSKQFTSTKNERIWWFFELKIIGFIENKNVL